MDVNFRNFQKSHKAFFFTGAVAILLVLLIASTMTWVAVSNARAERAPIITQGQQIQNIMQSILSYNRTLQVASAMALHEANKHIRDSPPAGRGERYDCIYPDTTPPIHPLCDPANPAVRDNVVQYYFCDHLGSRMLAWSDKIADLGNEMGLEITITPNT